MNPFIKFASLAMIGFSTAAGTPSDTVVTENYNPVTTDVTVLTASSVDSARSQFVQTQDVTALVSSYYMTATKETEITSNEDISRIVKTYFNKYPVLAEIAFCESTMRHYDSKGNVLRGKVDNADVGVMQINRRYHAETAEKLGYDLMSVEGNLGYALYLYKAQGTRPWNASKPCWGN